MSETAPTWSGIRTALAERRDLQAPEIRWVMEEMMQGRAGEAEIGAFLLGLRDKGETASEIAAAAQVLRSHMLRWDPGIEVLDTCGTGGDRSGTFNISTATAFVLAAAGVAVVKHGNRSVSSRSGSADVLDALGIPFEGGGEHALRRLRQTGLAFCFAPSFHPALRHVATVRKKLGVPSIFNLLGPLANPAGARRQLLGVGRLALLDLLADALVRLGTEQALVVHGADGLDEVSLAGVTHVRQVSHGVVHSFDWTPDDFDLPRVDASEVSATDPAASAALVLGVLRGEEGPALRLVLANAAAGLLLAAKAETLRDGVRLARQAVEGGRALAVLEKLRGPCDSA